VSGARALVVEDEQVVRDVLMAALRAEGYEVAAASEAGEALRQARDFEPDLAIVDVRLGPGPEGFAVARRLQAQFGVALLFLTGGDAPDELESPGDHHITKPFSLDTLLWEVEAVLDRSGGAPTPPASG
jgi:two-component system OmpR family response regulator